MAGLRGSQVSQMGHLQGSPESRRLALASNRDRLAELYGEHRRYTVNYIARRVQPEHSHAVEDLAQDTFVKAWPSLHTVDVRDGSSYRRWLTAVARSRVLDYYRPDRPNAAGRHGGEAPVSPHAPLWWSPRLVDDSAAAATDAVETRLDVRAALAQLPAETRRVLELRYLDGLSRDAVAQRLHRTNVTVGRLRTEGLATLRELLNDGTHAEGSPAPAGERALAVAREQAARHGGQWPTKREVARRAGVAEGTAAAALRSLRAQSAAETVDPILRARHAVAEAHQRVTEQAAATRAQQATRWHTDDQAAQHDAADQATPVFAADGAT
jgi:RNA polymerase sigma factor (sigma-70 family)